MHSFTAYIDEAGDEGFTFADWPDKRSSEWFVIAACVIRMSNFLRVMRIANGTIGEIEARRRSPIHFSNLPHEARLGISDAIGKMPLRVVAIAVNKRSIPPGHTLKGNRRLYFYYTRYLLERISWITRDYANGDGDGTCRITFSRCKNLSYENLKQYMMHLQENVNTNIAWETLNAENICVLQHDQSLSLRLADAAASGIASAFELNKYGYCEDRYLRLLKPVIYCNGKNYLSYGMKIVPFIPDVEPDRDNRYACIDWFR